MSDISYNFDNIIFEPTISILKNALLINYKKVGTRYFNEISSYPKLCRFKRLKNEGISNR